MCTAACIFIIGLHPGFSMILERLEQGVCASPQCHITVPHVPTHSTFKLADIKYLLTVQPARHRSTHEGLCVDELHQVFDETLFVAVDD